MDYLAFLLTYGKTGTLHVSLASQPVIRVPVELIAKLWRRA